MPVNSGTFHYTVLSKFCFYIYFLGLDFGFCLGFDGRGGGSGGIGRGVEGGLLPLTVAVIDLSG